MADYLQVSVISPRFYVPQSIDLAISKKQWFLLERGHFVVNDVNGNIIFRVEGPSVSLHDTKVILDAAGVPIVTLRTKTFSAHSRWQVFRGERTEEKDLIFSVKRSSVFQMKTKLHVFLANNISEDVCDYKLQGSWLERACKVYAGDSNTIIAQMHKNTSMGGKFTGKDKFMVKVYPNVDYAFIVALIVILDEMNSQTSESSQNMQGMHTHMSSTTV